ncbi:hypothetical protein [Paenibacillus sp. DS2015]|uniref:hypothetical protein n=1 Tax=Paenibacillus sp. DS2015 TaxID=3373917 RepID=UPI003D1A387F
MISLLSIIVVLSACSKDTTLDTSNSIETNATGTSSDGTSETDVLREEPVIQKSTGTFVGLADSHTVEILIDGKAENFQFGEELQLDIDKLKEDDLVQIEYTDEAVKGDDTVRVRNLTSITKSP